MAIPDRAAFFAAIRKLFGKLHQTQVDGFNRILDEWETRDLTDVRWLAYMLGTVWHETGQTVQPITEWGSASYLRKKRYWPWIGRGLVQLTWKANYLKFGITDPSKALEWPVALDVMFRGMTGGTFTGRKLAEYFHETKEDPFGARRIINGTDRASTVADHYRKFKSALTGEAYVPVRKIGRIARRSTKKPVATKPAARKVRRAVRRHKR